MTHPADAGGLETQICYLFVGDVAEHCARAKQAGAQMVLDIDDATATVAAIRAAISKAIFGILDPMILGGARSMLRGIGAPSVRCDEACAGLRSRPASWCSSLRLP